MTDETTVPVTPEETTPVVPEETKVEEEVKEEIPA